MNSNEITSYIQSDKIMKKFFQGVLPYDMLPLKVNSPGFFIVNTDPSTSPGKHWVCVYVDEKIEYFDSFGRPPNEIRAFISNLNTPYIYSTKCLQSSSSDVCGDYCVLYAYFRCRGYSMDWFLKLFSSDTHYNDNLIRI